MYTIAICDDEENFCSEIESAIFEYCKDICIKVEIEIFNSGKSLCENIRKGNNYDLIFLDIEMANINGVEVGKIIRTELNNQITQIVYVSCREEYLKELFEVQPMGFISKPFTFEQIEEKLRVFITRFGKVSELFTYKIGHDIFKAPIKNIIYFESINKEVKIVLTTGEDIFYGKLQPIFEQVAKFEFLNIHKSYIINRNHVRKFDYDKVYMSNGVVLPISQSQRKHIRKYEMKQLKEEF